MLGIVIAIILIIVTIILIIANVRIVPKQMHMLLND